MRFERYFVKIFEKISTANSLEELVVRRKRRNVGNAGLSYKAPKGWLVAHQYTTKNEMTEARKEKSYVNGY